MSSQLVGREEELQRVELLLGAARHGPRALLIEGEAGAGKTSVWDAALASAEAADSHTLAARPTQAETGFAYAALGDLLRDHLGALPDIPSRQQRALEVALLLDEEGADQPDPPSVALALLTVLRRLASDRPVVVAIDDVQWLDPASALVLSFAIRRVVDDPIALVAAWRTDGGEPAPTRAGPRPRVRARRARAPPAAESGRRTAPPAAAPGVPPTTARASAPPRPVRRQPVLCP